MASATPTRRALSDLPINTFGTPSTKSNIGKDAVSNKRPIQDVADPEYAQPAFRVRVSPRSQTTLQGETPRQETRSREASHPDSPSQQIPNEIVVQSAVVNPATELEEVEEGDSQNSCNSFIDVDPDDTMVSQQTAATELTQPTQSRASQHAETLRLRLRLAHFKVRTNQIHIPLAQLRISTSESPHSPERQPTLPKLLPAPILRPTAYSARTVTQPHIPSSPPSSPDSNPEKTTREEVFRTPALPRHSTALRQTNSPPDSQDEESREAYTEEDNLTSSAVRGKAAIGLLGLRQER